MIYFDVGLRFSEHINMPIIKINSLTKNFGEVEALKSLSMEVDSGQILGLLGPNGAGKSTLIKSLVGGVKPSGGSVEVFGQNPLKARKELASKFGYMPQHACLYEDLSAKENIRFFAKLHRKQNPDKAIDEILDFLDMTHKKHNRVAHLSGGMKTRISLACAMIHQPDILFLDEPTAGLDPSLKRSLWDLFKKLAGEGKTLFISTHLMDEALLCDHLAILRHGSLLAKDTPDNIVAQGKITLRLKTFQKGEISQTLPGDPAAVADFLRGYGLSEDVQSLDIEKQTLEDVTISIVEGREF